LLAAPVPAVRKALTRYRVMAWIVGVMLLLLVTGMVLRYVFKVIETTAPIAIAHGWLYMIYVLVAFDLCLRMRWNLLRIAFVVLAGTIPFVSFVAEHNVTKWVNAEIAEKEAAEAASAQGSGEPAPAAD
jgi:integral membrane protein